LGVKAQPEPDCFGANKRLFVKSYQNLLSDLIIGNASPSDLDSGTTKCYEIGYYKIIDSLGYLFFDFKIYQTIYDFSDDVWRNKNVENMHIYVNGLMFKDSTNKYYKDTFTYYLEIPKFYNGDYWIDVSKVSKDNLISVPCRECIENHDSWGEYINALNITPVDWDSIKIKNKN